MFKDVLGKKPRYFSIPVTRQENRPPLPPPDLDQGMAVCPACGAPVDDQPLWNDFRVCPACNYHLALGAWQRVSMIADPDSFQEFNPGLSSANPLDFPGYEEKLARAREKSGLTEAVITGVCTLDGQRAVLAVMDSRFMMGSMGSAVGEKITRAVDKALEERIPLVIFTASGGARMQEGMLALMQMARTSAAVGRLHQAGLLFVSVLTNPTTGGVIASFASLADVIISEPGALVGFTGPRVIAQTTGSKLPEGFQRAEFLLEHGMVDLVCSRHQLRETLGWLLKVHQGEKNG